MRDISDSKVLAAIAARHGLTLADTDSDADNGAVLADWEEGKRRGVRGSPEFFVGRRGYFCPALRIEKQDGEVRITPNPAAFDEFLRACFAGTDELHRV